MPSPPDDTRRPIAARLPHALAVLTAALTWPLLLVGGTVSVYRVGMAVPDWPTTFGINMFLYRFWNAPWSVCIEHTHRLFAAGVGLVCIVMLLAFLALERRGWLKALAALTLLGVIGQGVLGGLRVRWNSPQMALVHGCVAQAFFGWLAAVAAWSGRDWRAPGLAVADPAHLRRRALVTLILVYAQIVLGAWLRHDPTPTSLVIHAVFATAVWGHAIALAARVLRQAPAEARSRLAPSARVMLTAVTAQVALGVLAWLMLRPFDGIARNVTEIQARIRLAHQGVGALLLAATVVLTLRCMRHLTGPAAPDRLAADALPLEVVA